MIAHTAVGSAAAGSGRAQPAEDEDEEEAEVEVDGGDEDGTDDACMDEEAASRSYADLVSRCKETDKELTRKRKRPMPAGYEARLTAAREDARKKHEAKDKAIEAAAKADELVKRLEADDGGIAQMERELHELKRRKAAAFARLQQFAT